MKNFNLFAKSALAATVLLALNGCGGGPINHAIANAIKSELPTVIGPADTWDVDVRGNPGTILGGRVPSVLIHGTYARISPQITMESLDVEADDIHVDIQRRQLQSIDKLTFAGVFNQTEMDQYLAATAVGSNRPEGFKVRLNDNDMSVSFVEKMSFIKVPVDVSGRPAVSTAGDNKIDFLASDISVAKVSLPKELVEYAVKSINPAIDLKTMTFPVHLKNIHVENRRIVFTGGADIPPSAFEAAKRHTGDDH